MVSSACGVLFWVLLLVIASRNEGAVGVLKASF